MLLRTLSLCAVALIGCSKKESPKVATDPGDPTTPEPARPNPAVPADASVAPTASATPPATANAPATAPAKSAMSADGKLGCDALLSVEDFQAVCKAKVAFTKLPNEGEDSMFGVCSRQIGVGDEFPFGNLMVNVYKNAEAASAQWTADTPGVKTVTGIGDAAWTSETTDDQGTETWIKVRKGAIGFWLRAHSEKGTTSPCTMAQVTELAKLAASRLP